MLNVPSTFLQHFFLNEITEDYSSQRRKFQDPDHEPGRSTPPSSGAILATAGTNPRTLRTFVSKCRYPGLHPSQPCARTTGSYHSRDSDRNVHDSNAGMDAAGLCKGSGRNAGAAPPSAHGDRKNVGEGKRVSE